jgi:transposase-like protein
MWYLDEVFVRIQGRQQFLWRAVDEDGDVIGILVRFFRKLLKRQGSVPRELVTHRLASYPAAHRIVMPSVRRGGSAGGQPLSCTRSG